MGGVRSTEADEFRYGWRREIGSKHPGVVEAIIADTRVTAANRGERFEVSVTP